MVEAIKPNLGGDLIRIHKAITRAQDVILERSAAFAQDGFPDEVILTGFADYVKSYTSFLNGHHLTEDELAFPQFRTKYPDVPYDRLSGDHRKIVTIIDVINTSIEKIAAQPDNKSQLLVLANAMAGLKALWHPHIDIEEQAFSSQMLDGTYSATEQAQMSQEMAQHAQKNSGPDYLVVPFFLFNLSVGDRTDLEKMLPPIITEQLVPIVWKDKWAAMKPFLLL
jgi:hemerythrin-like domain-containing protein